MEARDPCAAYRTFQLFGDLPERRKSHDRFTDDPIVPKEGTQGPAPFENAQ